jgi:nitrate/TMAO reductase-like tetraheme cytochrome c subunit
MNRKRVVALILLIIALFLKVEGQISPGELADPHAHLEGISNCTKCHELGEHVSDAKCLACHKEIKSRVDQKKGFHSSGEVTTKNCAVCHNDHHGRKFEIVHFDKNKFDHKTTGYILEGKHKEKQCVDCHKAENIKDESIRKKKFTYLGLDSKCLSCHKDYHQQTLSNDCASCHNFDSFKPAKKFNHQTTKFPLKGKHAEVTCAKCHPMEKKNDKDFQRFSGLEFANCVACHKDVHDNKFGNDCRKCHSETSFHQISGLNTFEHNKTDFPLKGKHQTVQCKSCHKGSYTAPVKSARCMDCHTDYHKGQFISKNKISDCKDCHDVNGFKSSSFTIDQHNKINFRLEGAHLATPCFSCHKTTEEWNFRFQETKCIACHENIHKNFIDAKYIPEERCEKCHNVSGWDKVSFDHKTTDFELLGKHAQKTCRDCHFKEGSDMSTIQVFAELKPDCESCHTDIHQKQFSTEGKTNCNSCHGFENWKAERFNHNLTRFKLEGGHKGVECKKCHFQNKSETIPFIQYKNTNRECKSCHI